jgi:PDZ domain-containing protein
VTRRTWTLLVSLALAVALGLLGAFATVPYVALRPGPTFDTLGTVAGKTVVDIKGTQTYPATGHLNMTTVSVVDNVTLYTALALWVSGRSELLPRDEIYQPGLSEQQVETQNRQMFRDSEANAKAAALHYLGYPIDVVTGQVVSGGASSGKLAVGDRLLALDGHEVRTRRWTCWPGATRASRSRSASSAAIPHRRKRRSLWGPEPNQVAATSASG